MMPVRGSMWKSPPLNPSGSLLESESAFGNIRSVDARQDVCGTDVDLVRLIDRICSIECFEEIGQYLLPALATAVDAHGISFRHVLGIKPSEIVLCRGAGHGLPQGCLAYFQEHFVQLEILARLAPTDPGSRDVFRPREMIDHTELDRNPTFRDRKSV